MVARVCTRKKNVSLSLYDDPFDHPEIEQIIQGLWRRRFRSSTTAMATHGAGILQWSDALTRLKRLKEYGVETFQFAFHGKEREHDWFVRRKGAFGDTLEAARLCAEAGFALYWALFLNARNILHIPALVESLSELSGTNETKLFLSTWTHIGNALGIEHLRPTAEQFQALRSQLGDLLPVAYTEAYWVDRAIAGDIESFPRFPPSSASLDISETGVITHALSDKERTLGTLRQPLEPMIARYLRTRCTLQTIGTDQDSTVLRRLARKHGDPASDKIHTSLSVLRCWIGRQSAGPQ